MTCCRNVFHHHLSWLEGFQTDSKYFLSKTLSLFYDHCFDLELPLSILKHNLLRLICTRNQMMNHLGGGSVVRAWDQEVCSLCGLRFKPCGYSYDGHWRLTWSLTSGPVGLVEVRASWPGHPRKTKKKKKPNDGGNGPMKSITQQSKISMKRIGFKGIMWRFEIHPNFWQFSQVLQNACESLNMVGQ